MLTRFCKSDPISINFKFDKLPVWCHDFQQKDTQHNIWHNRTWCKSLFSTFSLNDTRHNNNLLAECLHVECRDLFIDMLNVIMLSVIMLNVIMLSVIMLNVIMLSVCMLNIAMLNVFMLNVVMLNVVMQSGVAPPVLLKRSIFQGCINSATAVAKAFFSAFRVSISIPHTSVKLFF
jgi:hypothetical protein